MADRINWRSGTPHAALLAYVPWRQAVERADTDNDLASLIELFRSDTELGPDARDLVADLLSRRRLTKPKGGQARPAYRVTLKEGRQRSLVKLVDYYRGRGDTVQVAITNALRDQKREDLARKFDDDRDYSDDEIDVMISEAEINALENRLKRGRK